MKSPISTRRVVWSLNSKSTVQLPASFAPITQSLFIVHFAPQRYELFLIYAKKIAKFLRKGDFFIGYRERRQRMPSLQVALAFGNRVAMVDTATLKSVLGYRERRQRMPSLQVAYAFGNRVAMVDTATLKSVLGSRLSGETAKPCRGPPRTYVRILPDILPFPEPFLQKGCALYFAVYEGVLMQA